MPQQERGPPHVASKALVSNGAKRERLHGFEFSKLGKSVEVPLLGSIALSGYASREEGTVAFVSWCTEHLLQPRVLISVRRFPMTTNTNPQGRPAPSTRPNLQTQGIENERANESGKPINPGLIPLAEEVVPPPHSQMTSHSPTNDISRAEEQRGTRRVWMWGVAVIAAIFVALLAVSYFATTS